LNIKISQGSVATEFRCGGRFYFAVFRSLSKNPKVNKLLKSVHICQSYRKNKSGTFFYGPRCSLPFASHTKYTPLANLYVCIRCCCAVSPATVCIWQLFLGHLQFCFEFGKRYFHHFEPWHKSSPRLL